MPKEGKKNPNIVKILNSESKEDIYNTLKSCCSRSSSYKSIANELADALEEALKKNIWDEEAVTIIKASIKTLRANGVIHPKIGVLIRALQKKVKDCTP